MISFCSAADGANSFFVQLTSATPAIAAIKNNFFGEEITVAGLLTGVDMEEQLKNIMGTKVVIHNKDNNKGKIEIEYYSQEDFERIMDLIKK